MTYRAHVQNGAVILDEPLPVPDGTMIQIVVEPTIRGMRKSKTLAELTEEQGVKPCTNLNDLAGDWPPEDDIDEFIKMTRELRK